LEQGKLTISFEDLADEQEIAKYFRGKDFMNAPWLFAEAYKYRRLRECFSLSKFWVDYGMSTFRIYKSSVDE
jgi:hypothetical protein